MNSKTVTEKIEVIVIGAGQAGLSAGYYLSKYNVPFIILEANKRIGDSWRTRWDSLHLFTPAKFDGLPGMKFPSSPNYFPTKDEMADYLEDYAAHFKLPIKTAVKVESISKEGNEYCIAAGNQNYQAEHVIVAMSSYQIPKIPSFAKQLDPGIMQLHSLDYKRPSQLLDGGVLVVGAGNSGAEISLEAARNNHQTWLAGRDVGHIPFRIEGTLSRLILARLVIRLVFYRILTTSTPIGRKIRHKITSQGGALIRIKPRDFMDAGIIRTPKIIGVKDGLPLLENNQILNVKNIVWCTGFFPSFSWIDLPIFKDNEPRHNRGIVEGEPGLYFIGLHFLYAMSSTMIHGAGRDAKYVVKAILSRLRKK